MIQDPIEVYKNGDAELHIYNFDGIIKYWIRGGVGFIEFNQNNFPSLVELLVEYDKEINKVGIWARLKRKIYGF
jgi:hypothetical protein